MSAGNDYVFRDQTTDDALRGLTPSVPPKKVKVLRNCRSTVSRDCWGNQHIYPTTDSEPDPALRPKRSKSAADLEWCRSNYQVSHASPSAHPGYKDLLCPPRTCNHEQQERAFAEAFGDRLPGTSSTNYREAHQDYSSRKEALRPCRTCNDARRDQDWKAATRCGRTLVPVERETTYGDHADFSKRKDYKGGITSPTRTYVDGVKEKAWDRVYGPNAVPLRACAMNTVSREQLRDFSSRRAALQKPALSCDLCLARDARVCLEGTGKFETRSLSQDSYADPTPHLEMTRPAKTLYDDVRKESLARYPACGRRR